MINIPSVIINLLIMTKMSLVKPIKCNYKFCYLSNNMNELKHNGRCKFVLYTDLLETPFKELPDSKVETSKYPPYPYYDAPKNLFFNTSKLKKFNENRNDNDIQESEIQTEYMKNAKLRRKGRTVPPVDKSPLSELKRTIGTNFKDYVYSEQEQRKEKIKVDLSEYDKINPGLGPWPSYEDLKKNGMDVNTSMFMELDPLDQFEKTLITKPSKRVEIKTIAEARESQQRWLERSKSEDWPLTYEEFKELPLEMREAYYENRFKVSEMDERFLMVLNYRRALENKKGRDLNPMEFDLIESDYKYTPKNTPVLEDLKNWDDPLECGWRLRTNEAIRDCVSYGWPARDLRFHSGIDVYDITWLPGVVKILVERTRNECGTISADELKLMLLKLEKRLEQLDEEEHTEVMKNHVVALCSKPDRSKELHSRREWNENAGKKVIIKMNDLEKTEYKGVLMGSDSVFGINIQVDDHKITLPLPFVYEVSTVINTVFIGRFELKHRISFLNLK